MLENQTPEDAALAAQGFIYRVIARSARGKILIKSATYTKTTSGLEQARAFYAALIDSEYADGGRPAMIRLECFNPEAFGGARWEIISACEPSI